MVLLYAVEKGNVQPFAEVHFIQMAEPHVEPQPEQKPGTGIDRTLIQQLLVLTPAERVKRGVREANNLARFLEKIRVA